MRAGNVIIAIGVVVILVGVAVRFGLFSWFGRLPGDIRVEGGRSSVFIPITSMLVVSAVGSILLNLVARFFRGQ
jgi:hypothetical protein